MIVADLSGATGNLATATTLYTSTMNGNVTAANRYGAGLTKQSSEQERFNALLKIAAQGAAQNTAKADTLTGAFERLKGAASDNLGDWGKWANETFRFSLGMDALSEMFGHVQTHGSVAGKEIAALAAETKLAAAEAEAAAKRYGQFAAAVAESEKVAQRDKTNAAMVDRQRGQVERATERSNQEQHAKALLEIATQESVGDIDSGQAQAARTQLEKAKGIREAQIAWRDSKADLDALTAAKERKRCISVMHSEIGI